MLAGSDQGYTVEFARIVLVHIWPTFLLEIHRTSVADVVRVRTCHVELDGLVGSALLFQQIVCLLSTLVTWVVVYSWWKSWCRNGNVSMYLAEWRLRFGDDGSEPVFGLLSSGLLATGVELRRRWC